MLTLVVAVSDGLNGPFDIFPATMGPVDLDARLPKNLLRYFIGCEPWGVAEAEAHSDDRGRKITTRVRTLELIAGRLVKYCKIENMAGTYVSSETDSIRTGIRTWNHQSLASHDKDDLHWTELTKAKLLSLIQRKAELDDEYCTNTTDADGENNIRGAG